MKSTAEGKGCRNENVLRDLMWARWAAQERLEHWNDGRRTRAALASLDAMIESEYHARWRAAGVRVRHMRLVRGMTRARLARAAGVAPATVRRFERRGMPPKGTASTAIRLARALDVSMQWLVDGEGNPPPLMLVAGS